MPFFLIDKPKGLSSFAVVAKIKHQLKVKTGHTGTLDPFATGLLILATEGDTKLIDKFMIFPKTYVGRFIFGQTSPTLDPEGEISKKEIGDISLLQLETILKKSFLGKISQVPPNFSAIKVNGKRAYKLAREEKTFSLNSVDREIYAFKILKKINENTFDLEFTVSNGTYIRALARDIAKEMETVGMLLELKRTKIGPFSLEMASSLEEDLIPFQGVYPFLDLEKITLSFEQITKLLNGQQVKLPYNNKEYLFEHESILLLCALNLEGNYKIKKRIS